jgi:hypothetical protein
VTGVLEAELGRVDAHGLQAMGTVFRLPAVQVWHCPAAVDAGIGPEIHQHHLAAQAGKDQRCRGVEPVIDADEFRRRRPIGLSDATSGRRKSRREGARGEQLWKERATGLHGIHLAA